MPPRIDLRPLGKSMFIFVSHLTVPDGDRATLERHFRERAHLVDGFPGFLYLQLLRPEAGQATHTFVTAWRDRAAFRAYMGSAEHATSHSREPRDIMARSDVRHEAYEVLMDSRLAVEWLGAGSRDDRPAPMSPSPTVAHAAEPA